MLCAVIDIGSNTTRLLVAEPQNSFLHKALEQKAYTRLVHAIGDDGRISDPKIVEVAEVVSTQMRLAREMGAAQTRIVATAAIRDAANGAEAAAIIGEQSGGEVEILSEQEEGRLAFIGATKTFGHPAAGRVAVADVGGGSTEVVLGTVPGGVESVRSWPLGSGQLAQSLIVADPPSPGEIETVGAAVQAGFGGVDGGGADLAVAVGGSANAVRRLIGAVVDPETLERAVRILAEQPADAIARSYGIDPRRVRMLVPGALLLEKASELLDLPLTIGKGGLREGLVLDLLAE